MTPTFRYHPSIIAQAFGTLGVLCPGRVVLGVGTGESLNEVPATGMKWPEFKERFARLRESIALIRQLWREERVTFEGQYYRTENATIYDKPETPVPIYVAAAGALVAKYAGRAGDGFICTSGKARELYTETLLPKVEEGLADAGRDTAGYEKMIEMKVSFDTDRQRALADTKHWAALALSPEEKTHVEDPREMERLADALPVERTASRWIVSDDPEEQVDRIRPYVEIGIPSSCVPCAGAGPAALPASLWGARAPEIAAGIRLRGMSRIASLELLALPGVPIVRPGDDLPALIGDALDRLAVAPKANDVLVIAQKIVSKAEGRYVVLADVEPSPEAVALGAEIGKDARLVQGDPVGIGAGRAQARQPAHHATPARVRDGKRGRGPLECGVRQCRGTRAAAASRPGRQRRFHSCAARRAIRHRSFSDRE